MGRLIDDLLSLSRIELKVNVRPDARVELATWCAMSSTRSRRSRAN